MLSAVSGKVLLSPAEQAFFEEEGYLGPFPLIEPREVNSVTEQLRKAFFPRRWQRLLRRALDSMRKNSPMRWYKGGHISAPQIFSIAADPAIVDRIESLIGSDILLWGSVLIDKQPGDDHGWHADVEHIEWEGVSVWIGLSGVTPLSSISVIARSHRIDNYPQRLMIESGLDQHSDDAVLKAAQAIDPKCQLLHLDIKPGEFILFAGRTWHEARHLSTGVRTSVVFQYSQPSAKIRMPLTYSPPVMWHNSPPPCCLIRGRDTAGINLVVPHP
jgi:hypothetical protein